MPIIDPQQFTTSEFYQYMIEAVVPRPIALASTVDAEGRVNLSPYSFFNAVSSNPPVLIFSPVNRTRDNTSKHTLDNVQTHAEVVINIVNYAVAEQMSLTSTEYERGVDEFVKAGLTPLPSERVRPPRVAECPVAFECRVQQVIPLGSEGGAGHLVVCEILLAHVSEAVLDEEQRIDPHKLDAIGRMGGSLYCRASGDALFEIARPVREKGIGVDQLPTAIRESNVLTGSDLAQLANVAQVPDATDLQAHADEPRISRTWRLYSLTPESLPEKMHELAQGFLRQGKVMEAWAALLKE
ncbi:MAG: flavin reductase family protein [Tunicatimonas sp.]